MNKISIAILLLINTRIKNGNVTKEWSVDPKSLKHTLGSLESYMDNFYHDSIKLHKYEKEREEGIKSAKELNPRYSGLISNGYQKENISC